MLRGFLRVYQVRHVVKNREASSTTTERQQRSRNSSAFPEERSVESTNGMKFSARKGAKRGLRFPKWQVASDGGLLSEL
jgi:hypothetical protein